MNKKSIMVSVPYGALNMVAHKLIEAMSRKEFIPSPNEFAQLVALADAFATVDSGKHPLRVYLENYAVNQATAYGIRTFFTEDKNK